MSEYFRCLGKTVYQRRCKIESKSKYCRYHKSQSTKIRILELKDLHELKPTMDIGIDKLEEIKEIILRQKQIIPYDAIFNLPSIPTNPYKIIKSNNVKKLRKVHQKFGLLKYIV
jgi:hypothetical protein